MTATRSDVPAASRPPNTMSLPRRATQAIAESPLAERAADAQQRLYRPLLPWAQRSRLHTDALGHSLHPALTDLTLGCWTSATLLDLLGGSSSRPAATLLTAAGIAAAVPTAVAGAADWAQTTGSQRRVGAVHALGADTATLLFIASLTARLHGHHPAATRLGIAANTVMIGAGLLGAHLALNHGTARRA
jgi:hypothetical protein